MSTVPFKIVKKIIHGQEVEVKVYPIGMSNYIDEEDMDMVQQELTVAPTGVEFYLQRGD